MDGTCLFHKGRQAGGNKGKWTDWRSCNRLLGNSPIDTTSNTSTWSPTPSNHKSHLLQSHYLSTQLSKIYHFSASVVIQRCLAPFLPGLEGEGHRLLRVVDKQGGRFEGISGRVEEGWRVNGEVGCSRWWAAVRRLKDDGAKLLCYPLGICSACLLYKLALKKELEGKQGNNILCPWRTKNNAFPTQHTDQRLKF